ncbi:hypothetical protein GH740_00595 [Microbacterium sp. SYP-A9085]|uniref:hypothetical protein n=1 Tax=Microbacterium sp. SYP-A9085 TaxID=2664454 RepID=UPI00129A648F|nr:hypothetical protein [Microbacterium sp. SYP-A9085]MRH27816.1 hypothetical protein [Microbacterium sp. SYP-A9085]
MTVPSATPPRADAANSKILRAAIWVAIGALIAAAVVCVVMVLVGTANGIVPRAFLTIVLMVAFAGVALMDTYLAPRRPVWFALTSMGVWIVTLLIGAVMIWLPLRALSESFGGGAGRFTSFLLIVLILQLAVLHVRLFVKAWARYSTVFTSIVAWTTIVLVGLLVIMLVAPLVLREFVRFHDLYWRLTVAVAILAAVGTALIPLVNALFAPRAPRAQAQAGGWPTYADGVTPLPVLADGQPDWNAYYTGRPTAPQALPAQQAWAAPEPAPAVAPEPAQAAWPAPSWPAPDWPAPLPPAHEQNAAPQHPAPAPAADAPQPSTPGGTQPPAAPGYEGFPPPPAPPQR